MPAKHADASTTSADLAKLLGRCVPVGLGLCLLAGLVSLFGLAGKGALGACRGLPGWIFGAVAGMVALAWICAAGRLLVLARAVGRQLRWWQALGTVLSVEVGVATTPGGTGGTAVRFALLHRLGVPFADAVAMFAAEWATDLAFFAAVLPLVVRAVLRDPIWRDLGATAAPLARMVVLLAAMAGVSGVFLFLFRSLLARHGRCLLARWGRWRLVGRLRLFRRTLRAAWRTWGRLRAENRRILLLAFVLGALQWISRYGILPLILWSLGATCDPMPLVLAQGLMALLVLATSLPGGGGAMEVAGVLGLAHFVGREQAVAAMLVWRLATYHAYVLAGCLALPATWKTAPSGPR